MIFDKRQVIHWCLSLALVIGPGLAMAQPAVGSNNTRSGVQSPAWPENAELLLMIQRAAHQLNYEGVITYHYGHTMQSSKITHLYDGADERERLETLDGKPREYLRVNNEVRELIPETQTIMRERRQGDLFPSLLLSDTKAIDEHYRIHIRPELDRVAGRMCRVVDILPRDEYRFGYRLCADDETALLLRARTVSDEARLIEQISFTEIKLNTEIAKRQLDSSYPIDSWKTVEPDEKPIDLYALGWRIPAPPGYVSTLQVSREFASHRLVNQLILSDGLATISIFIEPYQPERSEHRPRGPARNGSVNIYGVQVGDFWLTVLGEVPASALEQIAKSIQYNPSDVAH